jgi:hypothetical protein
MSKLRLLILLPLLLAACGDLPEPFLGNPGANARRLAMPEASLFVVPAPSAALLPPPASTDFAALVALGLQREELPALARTPEKTDWRIAITAARQGDNVVPRYAVLDPSGREQGAIDGSAVPAPGWIAGAPWMLRQVATDAAPKILALVTSIQATRDRADPHSLVNRVAKLYVPMVTGAPGDGNTTLTNMIRGQLAQMGPLVQVTPDGADFTVQGKVVVSPLPKAQQQVEIAWTVTRPSGVVSGKVSQLNAIPAGSLDLNWGDVATVVAQEAAAGIDTVVERFIGRDGGAPEGAAPKGVAAAGGTVSKVSAAAGAAKPVVK